MLELSVKQSTGIHDKVLSDENCRGLQSAVVLRLSLVKGFWLQSRPLGTTVTTIA